MPRRRRATPRPIPPHWRYVPPAGALHRANLRAGVRQGLVVASGYAVLASLLAMRSGTTSLGPGQGTLWHVLGFYYAAGLVGGAVYGLLAPLRARYWGQLLSAYLVLYIVYGGGTLLLVSPWGPQAIGGVPLALLLGGWAVLCLILAPIWVWRLGGPVREGRATA